MCGFAGVLSFEEGRPPSEEGLKRMAGVLAHRGPDEEGIYLAGSIGLAHRRLSIIDLVSGQQPMGSPDRQVWVVFNGEIYNYPELREDLERRGFRFRTRSDTEVLLAQYLRDGIEAFPKLNGMFACAFWDGRTRRLVLARDRLGKKPLFYYHDSRQMIFGSEIKAILAYGGIERSVNLRAMHEYLTFGYTAGEETILSGIRRLPPAHVLVVRDGKISCRRYWNLTFNPDDECRDETEAAERVQELLLQAVRRRLVSDVPLGAFLSGGIDSSTVVALMARLSDRPVQTFAIGFEEREYSELEDARAVAKVLGTEHHEMIVRPSALDILPDLVWHLDEPFGDSSAVPTYYVCRAARAHVKVVLSGDGGDEAFAGYTRYQEVDLYRRMLRIPKWIRAGIVRPLSRVLPFTLPGWNTLHAIGALRSSPPNVGLGLYPYVQERLYAPDLIRQLHFYDPFSLMESFLRHADHLDPVSRYQYVDTLHYLPGDILTKVDRMSMANSLEVRSPMLDFTLLEYLATLPVSLKLRGAVGKYILRKVCGPMLPPDVLAKKKQGFAIPKDRWFQRELHLSARELLSDPRTISRGYFRRETIERMVDHHATGRRNYSDWIWCLIMLEMWFRRFLDERPERL